MELLPKSVEEGLARLRDGELFLGVRLLVHDKDDELMEFIGHNERFYFTSFHSNFKNESQISSSLASDVQYRRAPRAHVISFAVAQQDGVALAEVFKLNIMLPFKDVKRTTMVDKGDLLRYVQIINSAYDGVLTQLARDRMMSEDAIEEYVRKNAPGVYATGDDDTSSSSEKTPKPSSSKKTKPKPSSSKKTKPVFYVASSSSSSSEKTTPKPVFYVASSSSSETRRKRKRPPLNESGPAKAAKSKASPAKAAKSKASPAKAAKSKATRTPYDSDDSLQEILRGLT